MTRLTACVQFHGSASTSPRGVYHEGQSWRDDQNHSTRYSACRRDRDNCDSVASRQPRMRNNTDARTHTQTHTDYSIQITLVYFIRFLEETWKRRKEDWRGKRRDKGMKDDDQVPESVTNVICAYTGWLKIKCPARQNAIYLQPMEIFLPKFQDLKNKRFSNLEKLTKFR